MIKKSAKDIFSLFSSSLTGQLIHVLALPFLTLYFSKTEIGAFFFFQALVTMGAIFVSLQSEQAIVIESNTYSYTCFKKSIQIVFLLSMFAFLGLSLFPGVFERVSEKSTISNWIMLVPLALFIVGANNSSEYLFTHEKRFRMISFIRIARPIAIYLFIFLFSYFGHFLNNLISGFIAGNALMLLFQAFVLSSNKLCLFRKEDFMVSGFKSYYKKHKNILIFNTLSTGISTTSMQVPYVFISIFFGERFNAYFGVSMRLMGMIFGLLGQSTAQVYFQKFSQIYIHKHSIYSYLKKLILKVYVFGSIPLVLLFIMVPWLYLVFLGKGWDDAAMLSRVLLPWLFLSMGNSIVSYVISILAIQVKTIYYEILLFVIRILGLYVCAKSGMSFITTMVVFSMIGIVFNLFYQFLILHYSKVMVYKTLPQVNSSE